MGIGRVRFYWGGATQLPDPGLAGAAGAGEPHPAYRGWCYFVMDDVLLGRERQEPPNLEVIIERAPYILAPGGSTVPDALQDGQANPLAVVQEALLDPRFGFDLASATLTEADWASALATVRVDNRNLVSVLIDSQVTGRSLAADLGDYGEFRVIANARQFGAVAWRREGQDINVGTLPIITAAQLAEMPRVKRNLPASLPNQWQLIFDDRGRRFGRDAIRSALLDARAIPGGLRPESLDRPFITIRTQAQGWLESLIVRRGRPRRVATLVVRRGFASTLRPGSVFRLDVDVEPGGVQIIVVVRIDRIVLPAGNRPAHVQATEELSFAPVTINIPIGTDATPYNFPAPFPFMRALEAPPTITGYLTQRLTTLAPRADGTTLGHGAYVRPPGGEAVLLGWQRQLALRGLLPFAVNATTATIPVVFLRSSDNVAQDEEFLLAASPGEASAANNDLFAVLVQCTGTDFTKVDADSAGQFVEFCSISATAHLAADATTSRWDLTVLRGRMGWPARTFTNPILFEVWIVRREDLPAWQHLAVLPPAILQMHDTAPLAAGEFEFRNTPFNSFVASDVMQSNPAAIDYPGPPWQTYSFGTPTYSPFVTFGAVTPAAGAVLAVNTTYNWLATITDSDGNLARVEVLLVEEGVGVKELYKREIASTDIFEAFGTFTTSTAPGTYTLQIRVYDSVGSANQEDNGTRTWSTAAPPAQCLPVSFDPSTPYFSRTGYIRMSSGTPGAEIWYGVGAIGSTPLPVNRYSVPVNITSSTTFVAEARKGGLTTSVPNQRNYYKSFSGGGNLP